MRTREEISLRHSHFHICIIGDVDLVTAVLLELPAASPTVSSQFANALGLTAGILTTLSFLPQMITTYRKRSAEDLSWGMLLAFTSGVVLWFFYGIVLRALPVILANAITFALLAAIMVMKVRYSKR